MSGFATGQEYEEAPGLQQACVAVVGGDGFHLIARGAQILEQRQAESVEGPAGVGHTSAFGALLQQAHQHVALVVLSTEEHSKHLDVTQLGLRAKPVDGTIKGQMAQARQKVVVGFTTQGGCGQAFRRADDAR